MAIEVIDLLSEARCSYETGAATLWMSIGHYGLHNAQCTKTVLSLFHQLFTLVDELSQVFFANFTVVV